MPIRLLQYAADQSRRVVRLPDAKSSLCGAQERAHIYLRGGEFLISPKKGGEKREKSSFSSNNIAILRLLFSLSISPSSFHSLQLKCQLVVLKDQKPHFHTTKLAVRAVAKGGKQHPKRHR
jgi:hypothetical protein